MGTKLGSLTEWNNNNNNNKRIRKIRIAVGACPFGALVPNIDNNRNIVGLTVSGFLTQKWQS